MHRNPYSAKFILLFFSGFFLVFAFSRCNHPVLFDENIGTDSVAIHLARKKVLFINIQGAKGEVMKEADIPNITSLLSHSIYSWDAVCDTVSTDQAGWASLFTGVHVAKSGVDNDTYSDNHFDIYPSFLSHLKNNDNELRIVNVNSSSSLNDSILIKKDEDVSITLNDDKAVKDSVINRLKNDNPDVLVATFSSVNDAGKKYGFSDTSSVYENAIHVTDGYIGDILNALRSRKDYNNENWLIVITSNHGGTSDGIYGGKTDEERNTFVLYNNTQFISKEIKRPLINVPYDGVYPYFYGAGANTHAAYSDNPIYQFGTDQDFTVEFNIRTQGPPTYNSIIATKDWITGTTQGWVIYILSGNIRINYKGAAASRVDVNNGPMVDDDKWHHISIVFNRKDKISIYMDGQFYVEGGSIKDHGDINTNLPLGVGTDGTLKYRFSCECYLADVRIWNTVLSPETIKEWAFQPVTKLHPDYNALIGYWKCTDGPNATVLKDYSLMKSDLTIENGLQWDQVDGILNPSAMDPLQSVPKSVDVATAILAWMGVKIQPSWNLDGKVWVLQ